MHGKKQKQKQKPAKHQKQNQKTSNTLGENICNVYMMGKVLPSLMCKEFLKIKINNPTGKWAKDKKSSWKREMLMALIMWKASQPTS